MAAEVYLIGLYRLKTEQCYMIQIKYIGCLKSVGALLMVIWKHVCLKAISFSIVNKESLTCNMQNAETIMILQDITC